MIGKLAFFAIGYVLGAQAGRKRYEQIVAAARSVAGREEVQAAAGMARSAIQVALENQGLLERPRGAGRVA